MSKRIPLKWQDHIIGWAEPGEFDPVEQSTELKNVKFLPEDQLPEGAKVLVRMAKELGEISIDGSGAEGG